MSNKILNTRVVNKHDIEANWQLATNFTPLNGEIIIYDEDDNYNYKRIKIGNGTDNINDLEFVINKEDIPHHTHLNEDIINKTHFYEYKQGGGFNIISLENIILLPENDYFYYEIIQNDNPINSWQEIYTFNQEENWYCCNQYYLIIDDKEILLDRISNTLLKGPFYYNGWIKVEINENNIIKFYFPKCGEDNPYSINKLELRVYHGDLYFKQLNEMFIPNTIARSKDTLLKTEQELTTEEVEQVYKNLKLDDFPTQEQVENLYKTLSSDRTLRFYCIEDVTVVLNGVSTVYPANSNVEVKFLEDDVFEVIPTSDNSILALNGFPGALGVYYSWLEGVKQFSNILFDMNDVEMYSKWSQGNQGMYQVQYAQYSNCIFWSDNPYISDVTKRTNYTLYNSSQLPLCYSSIPDNTFKAFYLALGVNSDPNWSNPAYKESFAKATYATQVFSYYGARVVGTPEHFNIVLPKDCRGLMFYARNTEAAGTFDATNVTNFGAKSGSWREAFGYCSSLRRLYITNLKVSLNVSWSPIDYDSIYFIISNAANTGAITISVSPYTYNLLSQADFDLAASKNITIALLATNYVEDKRLSEIANKADKTYVDEQVANLVDSAPDTLNTIGELAAALQENQEVVDVLNNAIITKADKTYVDELIAGIPTDSEVLIVDCPDGSIISHTFEQIKSAIGNKAIYCSLYGENIIPLTYISNDETFIEFNTIRYDNANIAWIDGLVINDDNSFSIRHINLSSTIISENELDNLTSMLI